jgi:hypothetical protein
VPADEWCRLVNAIGTTNSHPPAATNLVPARQAFATLLAAGRKLDTHDPAFVKQAATQFLSELFFTPLLAEARQFPLGGELGNGGQTEAIFGEQLDQRVADTVMAADGGLVQSVVRRLTGKGAAS